jgi:L-ascorbate metabolism protein UlaG (beta-lactamase superfamily)
MNHSKNMAAAVGSSREARITLVGGPTVLLELGGFRLLTDPTFDPPGSTIWPV